MTGGRMSQANRIAIATATFAAAGLVIGTFAGSSAIGIALGAALGAAVGAAWNTVERDHSRRANRE